MSIIGTNSNCAPCEKTDHWIEVLIRDEHNQPFDNVKGTLIDGCCQEFSITVGEAPILLTGLAAGRVTIKLDGEPWTSQAETRTPFDGEEAPTEVWLGENRVGYNGTRRELHKLTYGDFLDEEKNKSLPTRHQLKQLGEPKLATDKSHVVVIQGARFITLRLGMFFDGTANNTYSALWGKQRLDDNYANWKASYEASKALAVESGKSPDDLLGVDLIDSCFDFPDIESSATNEITNIQKLYDLYAKDTFDSSESVFNHAEYITGIGTGNSTDIAMADESGLRGLARGVGAYGVEEKVNTAIGQICNKLEGMVVNMEKIHPKLDGFCSIKLDVFGFSRGAAAARHFINVVLDGKQGYFAQQIENEVKKQDIAWSNSFNWDDSSYCEVTFAGLFDTVAAVANFMEGDFSVDDDDNDPVRLWLDPTRVRNAVHLVANKATEYRNNFCLNKINTAANFEEIVLPGAHSDLGGGYHSQMAFSQQDYLLPLLENKLIKRRSKTTKKKRKSEHKKISDVLVKWLSRSLEREVKQGWLRQDYIIPKAKVTEQWDTGYVKKVVGYKIRVELLYRKVTPGDLSRLYLRAMYGLAHSYGVPLEEEQNGQNVWLSREGYFGKYFSIPTVLKNRVLGQDYEFGSLCHSVLEVAKSGNTEKLKEILCTDKQRQIFMDLGLIHHSSDESEALGGVRPNKPNEGPGIYERKEYETKKNS
ncbi:hypothetical protein BIY21_06385 [Vibrio ponticus]|uniref:T6SS Phospholipase effector Tle1-like catalytic domain-containing protein n=1 Tax=Vibrio ponticus TaxID=265668 RepID=A0ABX3FSA2_9VIBR|nr:DUF2235 domain-containing protein [Vibrio ponticus]OLQ95328.1 hypothetical protein BIY21_06385 [Vibrio ponticus]